MTAFLVLLALAGYPWQVKLVARIPSGCMGGSFACGDTDHDSLEEVICSDRGTDPYVPVYEIWEHRGWNRYALVHSDTGRHRIRPGGPGVFSGNFSPSDIGDPDQDGLTDILGYNQEYDSAGHRQPMLVTMESPSQGSLPTQMSWYRYYEDSLGAVASDDRMLAGDLDRDGAEEILYRDNAGVVLLECRGNNRYDLVWLSSSPGIGWAFGDFDLDGAKDFAGTNGSYLARVAENVGPDEYELVWTGQINPGGCYDVFPGRDVNQNGKPEFFVRSAQYQGVSGWHFDLFMFEACADNTYERFHIAEVSEGVYSIDAKSECGDVDGDGVGEIVWGTVGGVQVLKPVTEYTFETVYRWVSNLPAKEATIVHVHDMNHNGYEDIVVSGGHATVMLEVEAIRMIGPNGGERLRAGDSCPVTWQTFNPPRCDSVSLFLRRDSTYRLDTIVTGLAPADTPYIWVVPDIRADSCWLMAIAYGPGWQYDETDLPLVIQPIGVGEEGLEPIANRQEPMATVVAGRLRLPSALLTAHYSLLSIDGRRVMTLKPGENDISHLAPGVYFIRERSALSTQRSPLSAVAKVIVTR